MRILLLITLASSALLAQVIEKDSQKNKLLLLSINHTFQIPAGNMADRFGNNSNISATVLYKTNKNVTIHLECGALFGPTVKEENLFDPINGNNGELISQTGEIPTIRLFERGAYIDINIGKHIQVSKNNDESGVLISLGAGYLYHKILIETLTTSLPQLNEDLIKGYDRLCGGVLAKEFIGYLHFSKKNNIRYIIGLEFIQAFTKDLRQYNYTTQSINNQKRIDHLFGLKTGFIIPITKRTSERYYYY